MSTDSGQLLADVGWRQREIDVARLKSGQWHARILRARRVLDKGNAVCSLDRPQPQRTVGTRARKDDPDGFTALIFRQRPKETVDGHAPGVGLRTRQQVEHAVQDGQVLVGRDDIDMVALQPLSIRDLGD